MKRPLSWQNTVLADNHSIQNHPTGNSRVKRGPPLYIILTHYNLYTYLRYLLTNFDHEKTINILFVQCFNYLHFLYILLKNSLKRKSFFYCFFSEILIALKSFNPSWIIDARSWNGLNFSTLVSSFSKFTNKI